ncbi:MAG: N-methyl-L-tryptophan oxidase [Pseudomonadota bacterium]|nr:N-methyl-L-tryptophan oxidase [Pseudomonadota bacterium]
MSRYDVIVLGLGAVGAATLYQLAKRGRRVLGIDQFSPPHAFGSSSGESRIIRKAIGEGDQYVPLVLRSYEIIREIEKETGARLLKVTGGLWISSPARQAETHVANFFDNTLAAARRFKIEHELLPPAEIRRRFPQFAVRDNEVAYYEPDAGYLRPEACVKAQLDLARKHGAAIRANQRIDSLEELPPARVVIVAAGAWVRKFLPPDTAKIFTVTRQVQYWFQVRGPVERFMPPNFPVWIWELQDRKNVIYGFPAIDGSLKLATEQYSDATQPEPVEPRMAVSDDEKRLMYETLVAPYFPSLGPACVKAAACLYTATPDFHFVMDRHPRLGHVIVASACSGHGFKHSAAVGEALAEWAVTGRTTLDISSFTLGKRVQSAQAPN